MVNFIYYFGYLGFGYMEFPLIWDILAGTNAFLVSGIVCMALLALSQLVLIFWVPLSSITATSLSLLSGGLLSWVESLGLAS